MTGWFISGCVPGIFAHVDDTHFYTASHFAHEDDAPSTLHMIPLHMMAPPHTPVATASTQAEITFVNKLCITFVSYNDLTICGHSKEKSALKQKLHS